MRIIPSFMTHSDAYRSGKTITPRGIMIHSVGCPQPKALVFIKQWDKPAAGKSIHGFIEPGGDVYQTLPFTTKAGHAGGSANGTHLGFEMTEPSTIKYTGGAAWEDLDPAATKRHVMGTYETAVALFALLCSQYGLDPSKDGVIVSHSEGFKRGIAANHGDVEHLWRSFGLTMDQFRQDVKNSMEDEDMAFIEKLKQQTGLTEDELVAAIGTLAAQANTKEEPWEADGAKYLKDAGLVTSQHKGNEPVEFGELGVVLKNFEKKFTTVK